MRAFVLIPFCLVLVCSAAQAGPRDDVMSNAYKCSVIGDSHQWLDCYYGAAQPVRSELGMPAITQGQARLAALPPSGGPQQDLAARAEVMASAARCYAVNEDRAWLDCYYGSAQSLRSQLGLPEVPHLRAVGAPAGASSVNKDIANPPRTAGDRANGPRGRTVSRMASYSFSSDGIFTVTLANGQTRRQLPGDIDFAHWKKPPEAYLVTISNGALYSHNMRVQGSSVTFKVEPVK